MLILGYRSTLSLQRMGSISVLPMRDYWKGADGQSRGSVYKGRCPLCFCVVGARMLALNYISECLGYTCVPHWSKAHLGDALAEVPEGSVY
jgi:hypothetical protein